MLIDTHAHLDYADFSEDLPDVISRARALGVERILTIGTGLESSARAVALAERWEEVFAVVGIHPSHVGDEEQNFLPRLRELAAHPRVVAIGETGLDYHHLPSMEDAELPAMRVLGAQTAAQTYGQIQDGAYKVAQADAFRMQLDLAVELGLNVVIHQRDAWTDTLEILRPYTGRLRGVFHCFGGPLEMAEEVLALGHAISFTGIVTFKNAATVQQTASRVPPGSFFVETDCPYLAPTPHRGGRCEPAHTALIAEKIASLRSMPVETLAAETTRAAEKFFRFPAASR